MRCLFSGFPTRFLILLVICTILSVSFGLATNARFIQPDTMNPTAQGVGTNRNTYSGNDPVNKSDPNGHLWGVVGRLVGGFLGSFFGGTTEANAPRANDNVSQTSDGQQLLNMGVGAAGGTLTGKLAGEAAQELFGKRAQNQRQATATSQQASEARSWSEKVNSDTQGKIPDEWGTPNPTKKGSGLRWSDPANKGNGIRIDEGIPTASNPTQQVDHIIVNSGGKVIGRDGLPIKGSIQENPINAHIPYKDWLGWSQWNKP